MDNDGGNFVNNLKIIKSDAIKSSKEKLNALTADELLKLDTEDK